MTQGMNFQNPNYTPAQQVSPNAVSINIYSPQAYGNSAATNPVCQSPNGFYSLYGQNTNPAMNYYPQNYNNMIQQSNIPYNQMYNQPYNQSYNQSYNQMYDNGVNNAASQPINQPLNQNANNQMVEKTPQAEIEQNEPKQAKAADEKKDDKKKTIIPLTDDYIKSLENYLNDSNSKVRLIAAKEILERFKEDENRKDNPSLMALLNKCLRDTSSPVRFLALTTLQLGYALGNDETVQILKEIQSKNTDKVGEDQLLASEILLQMAGGQPIEVAKGEN